LFFLGSGKRGSRDFGKKAAARSFYIGSSQNYRWPKPCADGCQSTMSMKIRHLRVRSETPAFGIQTVYAKEAGIEHGPAE
jgi:hypothetical protein